MYISCIEYVKRDLEEQRKILKRFNKRLQALDVCCGSIVTKSDVKGVTRLYIQKYSDGTKKQFYVTKKLLGEYERIRERKALTCAVKFCLQNIKAMEELLDRYRSLSPENIDYKLIPVYKNSANYRRDLCGKADSTEWLEYMSQIKSKYAVYRPEELRHEAMDGTNTRSKSEALIIQALMLLEIPFIYECPITIGEELMCPDFICLNERTGETIIVEHMGMMGDSEYSKKQYSKITKYINAGIVPNEKLILTFDTGDGSINMRAICEEFRNHLK